MNLADVYLICFIVGFALSLVSLMGGVFHFHVPGLHHGHHGHLHFGHAHGDSGTAHVSPFNLSTITAFLAWFGGVGYLLTKFSGIWLWFSFLIAIAGGLLGGAIVFVFLAKILLAHDVPLDPSDYDMVGVLGSLSSAIREDGIGEMSFSQAGVRRSASARSDNGNGIPRGADVIVTRYDKGVAYVRLWDDLNDSKEKL